MKRLILVVDPQMDFIGGTMTVKKGIEAIDYTCNVLRKLPTDHVLITADWHPTDHCSFNKNGGLWNAHCVQHSVGAAIYNKLLKTAQAVKTPYTIKLKGTKSDLEEYSYLRTLNCPEHAEEYSKEIEFLDSFDCIEVTGIAGDYCVLETLKDIMPVWNKVTVLADCTASIDGGASIFKFCKGNSIRIMPYKKYYEELGIPIEKKKKKK